MYELLCDYVKLKNGEKVKLCYMDRNCLHCIHCFILYIKRDDLYIFFPIDGDVLICSPALTLR